MLNHETAGFHAGDIVRFKRADHQGGAGVDAGQVGIVTHLTLNNYKVLVGNPDYLNTRIVAFTEAADWLEFVKHLHGDPQLSWSSHWQEYEPETKVIFRIYPDGDVVALFPEEASDSADWYNCTCYIHMGGHTGGDPMWIIENTRPTTPAEYASLKRELENYPYTYRLKVYQRQTWQMRQARETNWYQWYNASRQPANSKGE